MIKLYETINNQEIKFETTKFPDGTSQVWRPSENLKRYVNYTIEWTWEKKEEELLHIMQLFDLIRSQSPYALIDLKVPFLPYARQDKFVDPELTFSLKTFSDILNTKDWYSVEVFDVHNSSETEQLIKNLKNQKPYNFHSLVYNHYQPDIIFFPDVGALARYRNSFFLHYDNNICFGVKERDQQSGKLTKYCLNGEHPVLKDKKILIIDDLCDGGATFVSASILLGVHKPKEIALCVSHGLFTKGFEEMKKAGISKFYSSDYKGNFKYED